MYHVYIGFDGKDRELAISIKGTLERFSFTCSTSAGQGKQVSHSSVENMSKYINASRTIIFVLTPNSVGSQLLQYQISMVTRREMAREPVMVIPVTTPGVDRSKIPIRLKDVTCIQFSDDDVFYEKLIKAIGG